MLTMLLTMSAVVPTSKLPNAVGVLSMTKWSSNPEMSPVIEMRVPIAIIVLSDVASC